MSYAERDTFGIYKNHHDQSGGPAMMGANTLIGDQVHNLQHEHLGDIKEIMLDMRTSKITFAVLSFGGLFTIGEKLLAVPWDALKLDSENKCFTLNMRKERFEDAPRFDPSNWPNMADLAWSERIYRYYNTSPS